LATRHPAAVEVMIGEQRTILGGIELQTHNHGHWLRYGLASM
jgi:hypothetical protein